jgi:hypothetical protein
VAVSIRVSVLMGCLASMSNGSTSLRGSVPSRWVPRLESVDLNDAIAGVNRYYRAETIKR